MRKRLCEVLPRARYAGLEASEYLCKRYGWFRGVGDRLLATLHSDLVVCYDVLQYLPTAMQCARSRISASFRTPRCICPR